nr:LytTR family DNA-binding domain-containing protein [uncultured Flavobacterium sp.]
MTVIIIEDEIPAGKRLERLLVEKNITVFTILQSTIEAVNWFRNNHHPDLVFMDIKLRDDLCFKIFKKVEIQSKIIFTTAFDEYALKAFEYNSIDYLLKPIAVERLDKLFLKIKNNNLLNTNQNDLKTLENALQVEFKTSFLVSTGSALKKIVMEEIVCFKSENNTTFLTTKDFKSYIISQSLELLENQLNPKIFFRISRKIIINKNFIKQISNFNLTLTTINISDDFKISRSRVKAFLEFYKQ